MSDILTPVANENLLIKLIESKFDAVKQSIDFLSQTIDKLHSDLGAKASQYELNQVKKDLARTELELRQEIKFLNDELSNLKIQNNVKEEVKKSWTKAFTWCAKYLPHTCVALCTAFSVMAAYVVTSYHQHL